MEDNGVYVFDIEADNLLDEITKIHCLSFTDASTLEVKSYTDREDIIKFFTKNPNKTLIGHNIYQYDIPAVEKVYGIKVTYANIVDTLSISHYIHSSKPTSYKHGLESYGERFGVPKPKISDWENLTIEEYVHRCEEDVKINFKLWQEQQRQLFELYDNDAETIKRLIAYINSKLDVLVEQYNNPIPLNVDLVASEINRLEKLVLEKREPLKEAMPKVPIKVKANKPKVVYKADGSLSVAGSRWFTLLQENGLPEDTEGTIEYVKDYEEPNPDSTSQLKDWLFSMGWQPTHFKFTRNKETNEFKQVPQIKSEYDDTDICDSVKELVEQNPAIEHLASYSTIKHRITIFKGFLRDMNKDGTITAEANGWTNTMRLKHRKLVNLPKPSAPYAEHIRECLVAPKGHYMVGSDLKGIEDATKQSYIYPYDPEYVDSMRTEDWDAHLDIALRAGLLTEEQVAQHKSGEVLYKEERQSGKTVNFSSTYKVGANTLARNLKKPVKFAKAILDAFWKRNWAIKAFEKDCQTKTIDGQMWVKQPVSGFWYTLRSEKDIFSTVNQGTAVYVFDVWVAFMRRQGIKMMGQFHDETIFCVSDDIPNKIIEDKVFKAINLVNNKLKMNVPMDCSLDFGLNYKEVH